MITAPNLSLLFIMLCFWLVYLLVSTQLLKPLGNLLDQRATSLRTARESFEQAQARLNESINRCEREIVAAASEAQKERGVLRAEGEATRRARLVEEAKKQGQERLAMATAELQQASDDARRELRSSADELAHDLAERLLNRRVTS